MTPDRETTSDGSAARAGSPVELTETRTVWPANAFAIAGLPTSATTEKMSATLSLNALSIRILVPPHHTEHRAVRGFVGGWHAGVYGSQGSPSLGAVLRRYPDAGCAATTRATEFTR